MIDKERYLGELIKKLKAAFGEKLIYVGLQGSYLRNEATENSDIDIMVVLSELTAADMDLYRQVIFSLPDAEKSCGFICSAGALANWNPLEICHLKHTTEDRYGTLEKLLPSYSRRDIASYIKLGAGDLYHTLCHRYIHAPKENSVRALPSCIRNVFFILQDLHYLETDSYAATKAELRKELNEADREVWDMLLHFSEKEALDPVLDKLLSWCIQVMYRAEKAQ